ncbi:MAG: hypothetical protein ABL872_11115 [Lacibacter sp.]
MNKKSNKIPKVVTERNFVESVYHVIFIGRTLLNLKEYMLNVGKKLKYTERMGLRYLIHSKVLIDTVSLFDELNNYFFEYVSSESEVESRIKAYRHIVQPSIDEVHSWGDIKSFRHNVLAHSFRDNKNNFESVHLSNKLNSYNVPKSSVDLGVLFKLIEVITSVAEEMFNKEYKEALAIKDEFNQTKKSIKQSIDEEVERINTVLNEVNRRVEEYNALRSE